jgi:hypothetical protein
MTRIDLQARLLNYFGQNMAYYDQNTINDVIQDGIDEVMAFSGVGYNSAVIPFVPNLTYYDMRSILPDYIGVYAIFNRTMNRWMFPTSLRKLDNVRIDWETTIGTPYYFVPVSHRYLAIWMKPGAPTYGNMFILYRSSAPTIFDNTQIPIPDDHIQSLENFCITEMFEMQQEFTKAGLMLPQYQKDLDLLTTYMREKQNPSRAQNLKG